MTEDFRLHHRSLNGESRELSLPFEDNEEIMTRCFRDNNSSFVCLTHNITVIMHTSESMKGITHVLVSIFQKRLYNLFMCMCVFRSGKIA